MKEVFRRIVSTMMAVFIVASTGLVCAPAPAQATEGHCKPARSEQPANSHCPQKPAMDCCATSAPQPASAPQDNQQQNTGATAKPLPAAASEADAVTSALQVPGLSHTLRAAPPHGYRTTDLPTLNAVFLI